MDVVKI